MSDVKAALSGSVPNFGFITQRGSVPTTPLQSGNTFKITITPMAGSETCHKRRNLQIADYRLPLRSWRETNFTQRPQRNRGTGFQPVQGEQARTGMTHPFWEGCFSANGGGLCQENRLPLAHINETKPNSRSRLSLRTHHRRRRCPQPAPPRRRDNYAGCRRPPTPTPAPALRQGRKPRPR